MGNETASRISRMPIAISLLLWIGSPDRITTGPMLKIPAKP